jgi:hypothetical protein
MDPALLVVSGQVEDSCLRHSKTAAETEARGGRVNNYFLFMDPALLLF